VNLKETQELLPEQYVCMTMHRPPNSIILRYCVNDECGTNISGKVLLSSPVTPRTRNTSLNSISILRQFHLKTEENIPWPIMMDPLGYKEFLSLWSGSSVVLNDSGGLQEEIQLLTFMCHDAGEYGKTRYRKSGSNVMQVQSGKDNRVLNDALEKRWTECGVPDLWDGRASDKDCCCFRELQMTAGGG
jgi:UDP-N-acetylglucosamine 2-epimerase (non-hydrolysing)